MINRLRAAIQESDVRTPADRMWLDWRCNPSERRQAHQRSRFSAVADELRSRGNRQPGVGTFSAHAPIERHL